MTEPVLNAHNKEEYPPAHTAEVGVFKILSHDYEEGRWRVRWKVSQS